MKKNDDGQVIITEPGETLRKPDNMPDELHVGPEHDWKSKALEQMNVSQRRRKIIRKLLVEHGGRKRK